MYRWGSVLFYFNHGETTLRYCPEGQAISTLFLSHICGPPDGYDGPSSVLRTRR